MRSILTALILCVTPSFAAAHWIWIYPDNTDATKAHVVFSHGPKPDDNTKLLDRLTAAKLWIRTADGEKALELTRSDKSYTFALPAPTATVGGTNDYGVVQKGENKPFRLIQCPKTVLGTDEKPWAKLPIEIVPKRAGDDLVLTVYFRGKPAPAGLPVTIHTFDETESTPVKTDDKGAITFKPKGKGLLGFTVPHTVAEAGEFGGKKYEETRYSASLLIRVGGDAPTVKGDPEAIKLFDAARKARAHWVNFPGFTADIAVSVGGKSGKGTLTVGADYKLTFAGLEKELEDAAKKELTSVVGHRKDTSGEATPAVVFDTAAGDSPLGTAIRVVGDKNNSGYRVRDNQLVVTQRTMPTQRFVILAQENVKNTDGKFLPASHVVQYFDNASGKLVRCDSNFHSWSRVGAFDLPVTAVKMTVPGEMPEKQLGPQTLRITLSNHKLADKPASR
jgi:uncharacterized GH25 family protein